MHATARAAVALALLLAPEATAAPVVTARWVLAPELGPPEGEAMAARLAVEGPPGAALQLRAWLAGAEVRGAQAWNGTAWVRADRYQLAWTLDGSGRAEDWVVVRAAHLGPPPWSLQVRVRDAGGDVLAEVAAPLAQGPAMQVLLAGAPFVGAWRDGRLLALAPTHPFVAADRPWDIPGRAAIAAPPDLELTMVGAGGARGASLPAAEAAPPRLDALLVDPADAEDAEFVRLRSTGSATVDLRGWHLDGPSWTAVFAGGEIAPGATVAVARNASAYAMLTGRADHAPEVRWRGTMVLPNAAGSVSLGRWGQAAESIAWGQGEPLPAPGHLLQRDGETWAATSQNAAWNPRNPVAVAAPLAPFTTDTAFAVATAALAEAEQEVLLATYTFTHPALAGALHAALARGVRVAILVEGAPVGGIPPEEQAQLGGLAAAGAEVWRIGGSGRDRYGTMHAKYAVLDGERVLLGSENWTPSGFPEHGRGNVGWGAVVQSRVLAEHFASMWREDADAARGDVRPWAPGEVMSPTAPAAGALPPFEPSRVEAFAVPDNAGPVFLDFLARANHTLDLAALQLPATWGDGDNAVLAALRQAARRGVAVRMLLDGNAEHDPTVAAVEAWAREDGLPIAARQERDRRVHNKAAVLDGAEAWLGSMNFGQASMTRNRETALRVEGPAVATWAAAFEEDWLAAGPPPEPARAEPHLVAAPLALAVLAAAWRGWRRR